LALLLCFMVLATLGQPPIPKRFPGASWGKKDAPILVEVFVTLPCSDSRDFWMQHSRVIMNFVQRGQVQFVLHQYPLPYFIAAFDSAKVVHLVQKLSPNSTYNLIQHAFENQALISNSNLVDKTNVDLIQLLYTEFISKLGISISREVFNQEMAGREISMGTRGSWKFGAARGVYEAPQFFVNGVVTPPPESWEELINSLL
jgi:hypothetical protein